MAAQTLEIAPLPQVTAEQVQAIETGRNRLLERAESLVINSAESKAIGWAIINGIAELKKTIAEDFSASKKAAHAAWKTICAQEAAHLEKLTEPDRIVREKLSSYEAEVRRQQEEAERIAREEARKEQERLQKIADEQARAAAEQARKDAEEKRLQEAMEAEKAGKPEVAAAILDQPVVVAPVAPVVVPTVPVVTPRVATNVKVEGQGSMVENWYFEITNVNLIPREYLIVNESAIGKVVKALKGAANIPGIRAYSKLEPRTSGRR